MSSNISNVRLPYVYLIRHIPSGKFYAGSRYSNSCHPSDFWVSYFTSSKHIKQIIATEGKDSFEILEIIPRPNDDATQFESILLKSVNARNHNMWLNRTNGDEKFIHTKHTPETKLKMSVKACNRAQAHNAKIGLAHKGKSISASTKAKLSAINKISCAGKSNPMFGKTQTDETKLKISLAQKSIKKKTCGYCNKEICPSVFARCHGEKCKLK